MSKKVIAAWTVAACFLLWPNCSSPDKTQPNPRIITTHSTKKAPASPSKLESHTGKKALLQAYPNPIPVCDSSGLGVTTLSWAAAGPTAVQVRIGAPDGALFSGALTANLPTAKWVSEGTVAYLQDVSNGKPLAAENTLASVTITLTPEGCP